MGEYADMELERAWDYEGDVWDGLPDGYPRYTCTYSARPFRKIVKTCRYCGQGGLIWHSTANGWRLGTSDGDLHYCTQARRSAEARREFSSEHS